MYFKKKYISKIRKKVYLNKEYNTLVMSLGFNRVINVKGLYICLLISIGDRKVRMVCVLFRVFLRFECYNRFKDKI